MMPEYLTPLANHLWQSSLCALVAGLLTLSLRKNRASMRYWIWLAASVKFLIPFSLLLDVISRLQWRSIPPITQPQLSHVIDQIAQPLPAPVFTPYLAAVPEAPSLFSTVLVIVWFCGFGACLVSWLRAWWSIRNAVNAASRLDLRSERVTSSVLRVQALREPCVFGIFRPVLLLPDGIQNQLKQQQLEAILVHELCHIRRRDNLTATFHMLAESIFWFYPPVSWIGERLMNERERACDEEVLSVIGEPEVYAQGILAVCKFCLKSPLACASGITSSNLKRRIEQIMRNHVAERLSLGGKLMVAIAVITVSMPLIAGLLNVPPTEAQSIVSRPQSFEVASIKVWKLIDNNSREAQLLSRGMDPFSGLMNPNGRLTATAVTLRRLVSWAYGIPEQRVSGPEWIASDRYVIDAKAADGAMLAGEVTVRYQQLHFMLQSLLESRFALKVHRAAKEFPVYQLVIARNGPRLQKAVRDCSSPSDGTSPDTLCHGFTGGGNRIGITGHSLTLSELAASLSGPGGLIGIDRPVIDKTAIQGVFDFKFPPWNPYIQGVPAGANQETGGREGGVADLNSLPTMFTLLEEQFGLKLEATKGPLETIIIDHAEKPSGN
jgi:bla regulator protein BlaR1